MTISPLLYELENDIFHSENWPMFSRNIDAFACRNAAALSIASTTPSRTPQALQQNLRQLIFDILKSVSKMGTEKILVFCATSGFLNKTAVNSKKSIWNIIKLENEIDKLPFVYQKTLSCQEGLRLLGLAEIDFNNYEKLSKIVAENYCVVPLFCNINKKTDEECVLDLKDFAFPPSGCAKPGVHEGINWATFVARCIEKNLLCLRRVPFGDENEVSCDIFGNRDRINEIYRNIKQNTSINLN